MRDTDAAGQMAQAILDFRRQRFQTFPSQMLSDHPWYFLLELFVADTNSQRLTARIIGDRIGLSGRSLAAWLKYLSSESLVVGDGDGEIDDPLSLSGMGMANVERLMNEAYDLAATLSLKGLGDQGLLEEPSDKT